MAEPKEPQGISLATLTSALSEPRLGAYRVHPDEPWEAVVGRYRWNIALSMSFYPALHLLEVHLRNNLHRAITGHYGTHAWYDVTPGWLMPYEQRDVSEAKAQLRKRQKREDADGLVPELNFGFWTSLLGTDYEQKLWPRLLSAAFPHLPRRQRTRANVARRLHRIRFLRNRISHHEPIYKSTNLVQLYDDILEAICWLSPSLPQLLPIGDDFRQIHTRGSVAYEIRG
jgi:hypothetical protein